MKVVCINKTSRIFKNLVNLTPGKSYDVIHKNRCNHNHIATQYKIRDDDGRIGWYTKDIVMDLEEWREKQLNEIGI